MHGSEAGFRRARLGVCASRRPGLVVLERHAQVLAEVADELRRDFLQTRRREANENFYQSLRSRYDIRFEQSTQADPAGDAAE